MGSLAPWEGDCSTTIDSFFFYLDSCFVVCCSDYFYPLFMYVCLFSVCVEASNLVAVKLHLFIAGKSWVDSGLALNSKKFTLVTYTDSNSSFTKGLN